MRRLTFLFLLAAITLCPASSALAHLHPQLQRFVQRDPAGYRDSKSTYEYLRSGVLRYRDWSGRIIVVTGTSAEQADFVAQLSKLCAGVTASVGANGEIELHGAPTNANSMGCQCLLGSKAAGKTITIKPSGRDWPSTGPWPGNTSELPGNQTIASPAGPTDNCEYGFYNEDGSVSRLPNWRTLAHELCGHAWDEGIRGNRCKDPGVRGNRPGHDGAVGIENAVAKEVDPTAPERPRFGKRWNGETVRKCGDDPWDIPGSRPGETPRDPNTGLPYPTPTGFSG